MGLSFHDEASLAEVVSSLRFANDDPNSVPGTGSISPDGSLHVGPNDLAPILERVYISQKRNNIGAGDDIEIVDR